MPPLAAEPRQLLIVLNLARRKALYQLVSEITAYMRSQLELSGEKQGNSSKPRNTSANHGKETEAPLFARGESGPTDDTEVYAPELIKLRREAIDHFDEWRKDALNKIREIASASEDSKILEARKQRAGRIVQKESTGRPPKEESLIDFGGDAAEEAQEEALIATVEELRMHYRPLPTRLTTIPLEDRKEVLSCILILLLSSGNYSAYSRTLILYLASALELPLSVPTTEEIEIAKSLVETSTTAEKEMSADDEAHKRKQAGQASRYWKVGLASVAGAAVIGVTGGLAAPVVAGALGGLMGTVGLGGVASFLGIFWMNGALVGTLFGAWGAKMTVSLIRIRRNYILQT
jgi:hypothetical protein